MHAAILLLSVLVLLANGQFTVYREYLGTSCVNTSLVEEVYYPNPEQFICNTTGVYLNHCSQDHKCVASLYADPKTCYAGEQAQSLCGVNSNYRCEFNCDTANPLTTSHGGSVKQVTYDSSSCATGTEKTVAWTPLGVCNEKQKWDCTSDTDIRLIKCADSNCTQNCYTTTQAAQCTGNTTFTCIPSTLPTTSSSPTASNTLTSSSSGGSGLLTSSTTSTTNNSSTTTPATTDVLTSESTSVLAFMYCISLLSLIILM